VINTLKQIDVGTANITTLNGTTGTVPTFTAGTKLVIPTTAYTGSAPAEAGIYVTGSYLIVGDPTAVWKSVALG
jgi:hypothetical protein